MGWFDLILGKKKVSLLQCQKFLGAGFFGLVYLTTDNLVVKIEPSYTNKMNDGDKFGMEVVPTLNNEIKKHFIQIYSVQFLDYNPVKDLRCIEPGREKKYKFPLGNDSKYYKITVMENGGTGITLNNKNALDIVKQLINPVCVMLSMGYCHNDIYTRNILVKDGVYKIADYGVMRYVLNKTVTNNDFHNILERNLYSLLFFLLPFERNKEKSWMKINQQASKFTGPKKYLKYRQLAFAYADLFLEKDEDDVYVVDSEKLMECFYLIYNYNFYIKLENNEMSLEEYNKMIFEKGFFAIAKKLNLLLNF